LKGARFYFVKDILGEYTIHGANCSSDRRIMYEREINVVSSHYENCGKKNLLNNVRFKRRMAGIRLNIANCFLEKRMQGSFLRYVLINGLRNPLMFFEFMVRAVKRVLCLGQ